MSYTGSLFQTKFSRNLQNQLRRSASPKLFAVPSSLYAVNGPYKHEQ